MLATPEGMELAQYLSVAAKQASDQDHQKPDDDALDYQECFHHGFRLEV